MTSNTMRERVCEVANQLQYPLTAVPLQELCSWLDLLMEWNKRMDLTAARSLDELIDLAVADAFIIAQHIAPCSTLVDVGTGAGPPGLPLLIIRPDLEVTLVEPAAKRVAFLHTVLGTIGRRANVRRSRGESIVSGGQKWGTAVSRATLDPQRWVELGAQLVARPGGAVIVLLARQAPPQAMGAALATQVTYVWPLTGVSRSLCVYSLD